MGSSDLGELEKRAVAALRAAFPVQGIPCLDEMWNDHCLECAETYERLLGKPWDDVTSKDLGMDFALPLLRPAAVRYYLPALMRACIETAEAVNTLPIGVTRIHMDRTKACHEAAREGRGLVMSPSRSSRSRIRPSRETGAPGAHHGDPPGHPWGCALTLAVARVSFDGRDRHASRMPL
jgi:hypothetical protein